MLFDQIGVNAFRLIELAGPRQRPRIFQPRIAIERQVRIRLRCRAVAAGFVVRVRQRQLVVNCAALSVRLCLRFRDLAIVDIAHSCRRLIANGLRIGVVRIGGEKLIADLRSLVIAAALNVEASEFELLIASCCAAGKRALQWGNS